jgi:hypothetical protein
MRNKQFLLIISLAVTFIGCSKFPDLGNGYKLDYDGCNDICILNSNNTIIVDGNVVKYDFDSVYIIAEQKPREFILKETYKNSQMNLKKREKIFKESPIRKYWIINKEKDSIYGPYQKEEFLNKCEELGVPKKLKFEQK